MRPTFRPRWSDENLEQFADGELPHSQRARLAGDLLSDAALRRRLIDVQQGDSLARQALNAPARQPARRLRWGRLSAAAGIALVLLLRPWDGPPVQIPAPESPHASGHPIHAGGSPRVELGALHEGATAGHNRAARVVISVPVRRRMGPEVPPVDPGRVSDVPLVLWSGPAESLPAFVARFAGALRRGRADEAGELLAAADESHRQAAYRYISDLFQSASAAEAVLANLPLSEQVRVCREWAQAPGIRSVAFRRLRELRNEPTVQGQVRDLLEELAGDPRTDAWLRGYGLTSG